MKSSRAKRDRPFKNVAKQPNGAEHSKASMRRILGSVSGNMQAALNPTKPSSIPPFFKSAEEISRDTSHRSSSIAKKPRIPATDPKKISNLWQRVMESNYIQPTRASKAKAKSPSSQSKRTAPSETTYPGSDGAPSTSLSSRSAGITLDNPAFRDLILITRHISIDNKPLSRSAFQHFQTSPPARYQDIPSLASTTVWLEGDDRFKSNIVEQYKDMKDWGLCEAEYAQYALQALLKSKVRDPDATPNQA